jgi:ParB family chromosome partitioning protein
MNLDLTGLADITRPSLGEPLMLSLDLIDRDPGQPRKYFDESALKELAESIRANGVVQPISVRPDPRAPGRYTINYGERRFLASLIAGLVSIPVFVHKTPDDYTQVNENLHRADLSPMEMALFIQRRLDAGEKRNEIATKLGYKKSYVTEHLALLESPACVEKAYASGVSSARTLYDLRRLHDEFPEQVDAWVARGVEVTRDAIAAFGEKVRHDELARDAATGTPSFDAAVVARDTIAASAEKVRHDELARHAAPASTSSNGAVVTPDTIVASGEKVRHDELARHAATVSTSSDEALFQDGQVASNQEQTASTAAAKLLPRRLRIKVNHGGRNALIDDDSIVRLRYDDGGTADVRLADAIVLAAVAA